MSVDGMPRHVLDVLRIINVSDDGVNSNGQKDEVSSNTPGTEASSEVLRWSLREGYPPHCLANYETSL